jgi:ABC-type multidrug transport system fused ATPase/permease subunit
LKNINLKIEAGEKIAVVGLNGAGKTPLVHLICGMYTPTEGNIFVNGHDINDYNREEYYSIISAVFQQYKFLPVSISQNISISSPDLARLQKCIDYSGIQEKINTLPDGINTPLIKELNLNGTELSGGESQKLLLARAIYKPSSILVLDEPTAALDPIAESELYEKYSGFALWPAYPACPAGRRQAGKTSLFISHRLASTRFCDRIVYIEDGEIREIGAHNDLLNANGRYAELFNIQSYYYRDNIEDNGGVDHE